MLTKITVHSRNNIVNFEATKKELEKRVSSRERDSKEGRRTSTQQAEAKLQAELERSKIERQKEAEKVQMTIRSLSTAAHQHSKASSNCHQGVDQ